MKSPSIFWKLFTPGFLALILLCLPAAAASVTLEWDANEESDLSGYRLYIGTEPGNYSTVTNVGNSTRATVPNLQDATTYYFVVTAYNTLGLESVPSNEVTFTTPPPVPNQPPQITVSEPGNGNTYLAPASLAIVGQATDADGTVQRVEFYSGGQKLGESTVSPFSFTWNDIGPGEYSITAVAYDNAGESATSTPVVVTVRAPNQAPAIAITDPVAGSITNSPGRFTISANATDSDGSISRVQFFNGAVPIGECTSLPYTITWDGVPAGNYSLVAVATDDSGATTVSAPVAVSVNALPTVSLSSNAPSYLAPATVQLTASAADADGSVARVEFYNGSAKLGEKTAAPYTWTWSSVAAGNYTLRAIAFDNRGAAATSNEVRISVSAVIVPPTVTLTSPTNGAVFTSPQGVPMTANASDSDGTIARVEFFAGSNRLATDTTAPFTFTWNNAPIGTHNLTAVAYDNSGTSATSSIVKITVNAPPIVSVSLDTTKLASQRTVTINATASDPNGTVRRVEFFAGSVLLAKDTSKPYRFDWKNIPSGTHTITAKAYDNLGAVTTSAPVSFSTSTGQIQAMIARTLPTVKPAGRTYEGEFALNVEGTAGQVYDVWYSEDLESWSLLVSVMNHTGAVSVTDPYADPARPRFYRVSVQ